MVAIYLVCVIKNVQLVISGLLFGVKIFIALKPETVLLPPRTKVHDKNISNSEMHALQKNITISFLLPKHSWREWGFLQGLGHDFNGNHLDYQTGSVKQCSFSAQRLVKWYGRGKLVVGKLPGQDQRKKATETGFMPLHVSLSLSSEEKTNLYLYENQWQRQKGQGSTLNFQSKVRVNPAVN